MCNLIIQSCGGYVPDWTYLLDVASFAPLKNFVIFLRLYSKTATRGIVATLKLGKQHNHLNSTNFKRGLHWRRSSGVTKIQSRPLAYLPCLVTLLTVLSRPWIDPVWGSCGDPVWFCGPTHFVFNWVVAGAEYQMRLAVVDHHLTLRRANQHLVYISCVIIYAVLGHMTSVGPEDK